MTFLLLTDMITDKTLTTDTVQMLPRYWFSSKNMQQKLQATELYLVRSLFIV